MKPPEHEPNVWKCHCAPLGCPGLIPQPGVGQMVVSMCPFGCSYGTCSVHGNSAAAPRVAAGMGVGDDR